MKSPAKIIMAVGAILFAGSVLVSGGGIMLAILRASGETASSEQVTVEGLSRPVVGPWELVMIGLPIGLLGLCLLIAGACRYFADKQRLSIGLHGKTG